MLSVAVDMTAMPHPLLYCLWLQASLPVQEFMDMPLNKERDELDAARLLPVYVLGVQSAYIVCLPYE